MNDLSGQNPSVMPLLDYTKRMFEDSEDIVHRTFPEISLEIIYSSVLIDNSAMYREVIVPLSNIKESEVNDLMKREQFVALESGEDIVAKILDGHVAIFYQQLAYVISEYGPEYRSISVSPSEMVVAGPNDAFVESLNTNISLIRRRLKNPTLKFKSYVIGSQAKSKMVIAYLEDHVNQDWLSELDQRIEEIQTDSIQDTHILVQYIEDDQISMFPQFHITQRPDVVISKLLEGKIVGLLEGSPNAFSAPSQFFDFLESPDDYGQRWIYAIIIRFFRYLAVIVTLLGTALYVAITTYHYEMVPQELLISLSESRSKVPFPPVIEALILELTIEFLREAGIRLPIRIGQTLGIVGGIVLGEASVAAGFTSNILVITIAGSTLASLVLPNYTMSIAFRSFRFLFIILAALFGNFGIFVSVIFLVNHLAGLTSLNTPYLYPLAPAYPKTWKYTFMRSPYQKNKK
ncbi:spore germination protein [Paenibacillus terrigena]|uniref:spore germination protein n=1 Tax=Paenibacillus terrigena TaxID=369333 RepID=UPI00036F4492|nr:spore germination protein [Paenibacillus terrigena]